MASVGNTSSRMFFFRVSTDSAASVNPGAASTSVNTSAICSANSVVTTRLTAMTPPNAETGSQASARSWARAMSSSVPPGTLAMPQGLACLTIAQVGAAKSVAIRQAASMST